VSKKLNYGGKTDSDKHFIAFYEKKELITAVKMFYSTDSYGVKATLVLVLVHGLCLVLAVLTIVKFYGKLLATETVGLIALA